MDILHDLTSAGLGVAKGLYLAFAGTKKAFSNLDLKLTDFVRRAKAAVAGTLLIFWAWLCLLYGFKIAILFWWCLIGQFTTRFDKTALALMDLGTNGMHIYVNFLCVLMPSTTAMDDFLVDSIEHSSRGKTNQFQAVISAEKPKHTKRSLPHLLTTAFKKFFTHYTLTFIFFALSFIPKVGPVLSLAAFAFHIRTLLGPIPSLVVGLYVYWKAPNYGFPLFNTSLQCLLLARSLLQPYFARRNTSTADQVQWLSAHHSILMGFAWGFVVLMHKWWLLGVFFYGVAQMAMGYLVVNVK